jgi:small subunit ribosomal protein S7
MEMGQKLLARTLMENTFQTIKRIQLEKIMKTTDAEAKAKIIANPYALLNLAVENGRPFLETTPIKRGGHTYQVPVPLSENRSYFLSIKWLIEAGNEKESEVKFATKFAYEIIEASNNQGKVIKRKQDLHKLCEANRAYAHYRWS